jgi:hypothetical protein
MEAQEDMGGVLPCWPLAGCGDVNGDDAILNAVETPEFSGCFAHHGAVIVGRRAVDSDLDVVALTGWLLNRQADWDAAKAARREGSGQGRIHRSFLLSRIGHGTGR